MVVIGGVLTEDAVGISVLVGNTGDLKEIKQSFCSTGELQRCLSKTAQHY